MPNQIEQLRSLIKNFNTTPFLFIGSGITRRYYNLPSWEGLLQEFAARLSHDEFAYGEYEDLAKREAAASQGESETCLEPIIASLIEGRFNERWFSDPSFRRLDAHYLEYVRQKRVSPFKAEIAQFLMSNSSQVESYKGEIEAFRQLFSKHISGIITTNYDTFLESIAPDYKVYVGQEQLLFSSLQGVAEIYKIHGCVTKPEEIVINSRDYNEFHNKSAYLASKLMTIFVEYPIIFIGYSLSDPNIQTILQSIVGCMSESNVAKLQDRFIFVDFSKIPDTLQISPGMIQFSGAKSINVTNVILHDYSLLYKALLIKKTALPAKVVRFFREEFYNFVQSNIPSKHILVGSINEPRINDEDLLIGVGTFADFGEVGLKAINVSDWMQNIVDGKLMYSADQLLANTYPELNKSYYNKGLPVNKYLSEATLDFPEAKKRARNLDFEEIISKTIKNDRDSIGIPARTIQAIDQDPNITFEKKLRLIAHLRESEIDIDYLEKMLRRIFDENPLMFETCSRYEKTHLNRLIRIYDYLKYRSAWE